jgi:hypothetical protein
MLEQELKYIYNMYQGIQMVDSYNLSDRQIELHGQFFQDQQQADPLVTCLGQSATDTSFVCLRPAL